MQVGLCDTKQAGTWATSGVWVEACGGACSLGAQGHGGARTSIRVVAASCTVLLWGVEQSRLGTATPHDDVLWWQSMQRLAVDGWGWHLKHPWTKSVRLPDSQLKGCGSPDWRPMALLHEE